MQSDVDSDVGNSVSVTRKTHFIQKSIFWCYILDDNGIRASPSNVHDIMDTPPSVSYYHELYF